METLELKHLAPYLPFKIQGRYARPSGATTEALTVDFLVKLECSYSETVNNYRLYKPLLHPLSQLTGEIEHNGLAFFPIDALNIIVKDEFKKHKSSNWIRFDKELNQFVFNDEGTKVFYYMKGVAISFYNKLLEWHFDVFGLIEKGLAIPKDNNN